MKAAAVITVGYRLILKADLFRRYVENRWRSWSSGCRGCCEARHHGHLAFMEAALEQIAALLKKAARILFITGAGVSAESGVPTFRGATGAFPNGLTRRAFRLRRSCPVPCSDVIQALLEILFPAGVGDEGEHSPMPHTERWPAFKTPAGQYGLRLKTLMGCTKAPAPKT